MDSPIRHLLGNLEASLDEDTLVLGVTVENTGAFAGREVVQVYVSAPVSEMDMPEQELKVPKNDDCWHRAGKISKSAYHC